MKKIVRLIFWSLCFCVAVALFATVYKLGVLPSQYLSVCIGALSFLLIIVGALLLPKKLWVQFVGVGFGFLFMIIEIVLIVYLNKTDYFLSKAFSGKTIETTNYYLVSSKDVSLKNEGQVLYYEKIYNKKKIIDLLNQNYEFNFVPTDNMNSMIEDVLNGRCPYLLIESTSYHVIESFDKRVGESLQILKTFSIEEEKQSSAANQKLFHIYVVGTDFAGLNDFNMIVTVNKAKKKVLLTSIPRDMHIPVYGFNGVEDNLTYLSILGVDTSIHSLENFFDITIDYYVKVNTHSLVTLVDAVGGITYCSDIEFTTSHSLVLDTYKDYGKKFHVQKGCQDINGIEALTIARERVNIPGSDIARQENCRKIIIAIFNKMKSTNTFLNYQHLLDVIAGSYETTIPRSVIEKMAQKVLRTDSRWKIEESAVTGVDKKGLVHLNTHWDYILIPNEDSVIKAKDKMKNLGK